jgi:hypothetical protein
MHDGRARYNIQELVALILGMVHHALTCNERLPATAAQARATDERPGSAPRS